MSGPTRRPRVLIVEDYVPDATLGSGYGRMIDTIEELREAGAQVSLFPTLGGPPSGASLPAEMEVVDGPLPEHLAGLLAGGGSYDVVVISRPHNYEDVAPVLRTLLPGVPVVYDAEALYFRRLERQADQAEGTRRAELLVQAASMRGLEERIASEADQVVCIAAEEAALLAPYARRPIFVNSPLLSHPTFTPQGFSERRGMGFVAGWSAGPLSPNIDGLQWFARHVLPRVLARVPGATMLVTGADPPSDVRRFEGDHLRFVGVVDLLAFYAGLRVSVVPIRYGSGVKLKAVEALQFGVPTVATPVGAEGVPIDVPGALRVSSSDDPVGFAEVVAALLDDAGEWESQRRRVAEQCERWSKEPTGETWPEVVARLLDEFETATQVGARPSGSRRG